MTIKNKADKAMVLCEIQTHSAAHMSYSITTFVCPVLQEKDLKRKIFQINIKLISLSALAVSASRKNT